MPRPENESFTATVRITRTRQFARSATEPPAMYTDSASSGGRVETTFIELKVRAETQDKLVEKINLHLALVDETDYGVS